MNIFISNLLSESILDFRKWSNWKYAKTRICVFSVWPLPKVENWFWKQIWNENVYISISKIFFGAYRSIFEKFKKMYFFLTIFFSEKAKYAPNMPRFGANMGKT